MGWKKTQTSQKAWYHVFLNVCSCNGYLVVTLDKIDFQNNVAIMQTVLKVLHVWQGVHVRGCDQIEMAIITTRSPGSLFFSPWWFWTANNAGSFQTFTFCFCNLKFFWIEATWFCKKWGVAACVNVVVVDITSPVRKMKEIFEVKASHLQAQNQKLAAMKWVLLLAKQIRQLKKSAKKSMPRWDLPLQLAKRGLVVHLPPLGGDQMDRHWMCKEQYSMLLQWQPNTCH